MTDKIEVLAPCGSYNALVAAVNAGADACYLSAGTYGARAYAANFSEEELHKALEYAHSNDVRIYLTVNTLLKNNEIKKVPEFLAPFYFDGLDAVIVQDLGVFSCIKDAFPDIDIHCSTQMNITSVEGARFMKEQGAKRIVTAREMSLAEIKEIADDVDIEIETFVHGAMCFCYSGRCLLSSSIGERSGNRGRCAQPCRKLYNNAYYMSMKDMCTLKDIPRIVDAGIDSLKIEGRMKNEYYVAATVDAYKTMVDDYRRGAFSLDKAMKYQDRLAEIFNRGGFSGGYFFKNNGLDMLSTDKPGNAGVKLGKVKEVSSGKITLVPERDINAGDNINIELGKSEVVSITSGSDYKAGSKAVLNAPKTKLIKPGMPVIRMKNEAVTKIASDIYETKKRLPVSFKLIAVKGRNLYLEASVSSCKGKITATGTDNVVTEAMNKPVTEEILVEKLSKLGDTNYYLASVDAEVDKDIFVQMSAFNKLRREVLDELHNKVVDAFRREETAIKGVVEAQSDNKDRIGNSLIVSVMTLDALEVIVRTANLNKYDEVYIDYALLKHKDITKSIELLKNAGKKVILALPYIHRTNRNTDNIFEAISLFDGVLVRNIDSVNKLLDVKLRDKIIIVAASLYGYNDQAIKFINDTFKDRCKEIVIELPKELNKSELSSLTYPDDTITEFTMYGREAVMVTAQCMQSSFNGKCMHKERLISFTDELGNTFWSASNCEMCYNVIYNSVPTSIHNDIFEADRYRIEFTSENSDEIEEVLNGYFKVINGEKYMPSFKYTTGQYQRGIL